MKCYRLLLFSLLIQAVVACKKDERVTESKVEETSRTETVIDKIKGNPRLIKKVTFDTLVNLHPGVTQSNIRYQTPADKPMALYILEIDLNNQNVGIHTLTPQGNKKFALQEVTELAREGDKPKGRIIAAVNGDYFYWTGEPWGPVVANGEVVRNDFFDTWHGFFGITKTGIPSIGAKGYFVTNVASFKEAIGGTERLINGGLKISHENADRHPRTIVGYTSKNIVYIVVVDGRQASHSIGMTLAELSEVMFTLGCKDALNLDGGGSSTLVVRKKGTNTFEVKNKYSDASPRKVANALSVISYTEN